MYLLWLRHIHMKINAGLDPFQALVWEKQSSSQESHELNKTPVSSASPVI